MILPFRAPRRPGRRPRHLVHGRARALQAPDPASGDEGAITFWQTEVHQFEFRAGEQGALAQGVLAVAAALTIAAVTAFAAADFGAGSEALNELNIWVKLAFLMLPVAILLLLTTALRLLGEASLLRECVHHAETELEKLTSEAPGLNSYRKWTDLGLPYDAPRPFLMAFVPLTVIICFAGVFGPTILVWFSLGWAVGWVPTAVAIYFAITLWFFARANDRNARALRNTLKEARGGQRLA